MIDSLTLLLIWCVLPLYLRGGGDSIHLLFTCLVVGPLRKELFADALIKLQKIHFVILLIKLKPVIFEKYSVIKIFLIINTLLLLFLYMLLFTYFSPDDCSVRFWLTHDLKLHIDNKINI